MEVFRRIEVPIAWPINKSQSFNIVLCTLLFLSPAIVVLAAPVPPADVEVPPRPAL